MKFNTEPRDLKSVTAACLLFVRAVSQQAGCAKEIQIIADKVDKIMSVLYPVSWNALCKGGT